MPTVSSDCYKRREVVASYLSCLILDNRFLTALGQDKDLRLGSETQGLSREILQLHCDAYSTSPQGGLFVTYSLQIAQAALTTANEWGSHIICAGQEGRNFIERETFRRWNGLLGRIIYRKPLLIAG